MQGRVHFGGALSGRDTNAVNKTVSGLLGLLFPDAAQPVPDEDLEWAIRLTMEVRRRVKEQQKRVGSAEFRNTRFSYAMGLDGVEKFIATTKGNPGSNSAPRGLTGPQVVRPATVGGPLRGESPDAGSWSNPDHPEADLGPA